MTGETPAEPSEELKDYFFNLILYRQSNLIPPFLEKYPDSVNWRFSQDLTPLMESVMQQHHDITGMLLKAGAKVDDRAVSGVNPMYYAGRSVGAIDLLLDYGADINMATDNGSTALINATENWDGGPAALKLIERGANLEVVGWDNCTPLLKAAWQGAPAICSALLRMGANINAVDNQGRNAKQIAEWGRDHNTENSKYLKTLEVLEPAFAAKSRQELLAALDGIHKEVEDGVSKPVTVGKALRFRPRDFYRFCMKH